LESISLLVPSPRNGPIFNKDIVPDLEFWMESSVPTFQHKRLDSIPKNHEFQFFPPKWVSVIWERILSKRWFYSALNTQCLLFNIAYYRRQDMRVELSPLHFTFENWLCLGSATRIQQDFIPNITPTPKKSVHISGRIFFRFLNGRPWLIILF